jgi:deazaflavin-dependent oxidoreductase (nitroreductase family)
MATLAPSQISASVCYLETIGRVTGQPHGIEIWFAADSDTIWMLSGSGDQSDWVKNLQRNPAVRIRIAGEWVSGLASVVADPVQAQRARERIAAKYYGWTAGPLPNEWNRTSLPIAIAIGPNRGLASDI